VNELFAVEIELRQGSVRVSDHTRLRIRQHGVR